jgi:molybdate transport system substrate-binding protein
MVRGENIGQTFQFIKSGNAELGFVALSQIMKPGAAIAGSYWLPSQALYDPIAQQAVLLKDNVVARQFIDFVKNDEQALAIIRAYGYGVEYVD